MSNTSAVTPVLNGNKVSHTFKDRLHIFVKGKGCYVPSRDLAISLGTSPNGVGLFVDSIEFQGQTWYRAGNLNVWD